MAKAELLSPTDRLSYVSDKYIFVFQRQQGNIFVFDRDGKIITHFNRKGRGDKEYNQLVCAVFDEHNEEIFVFDSPPTYQVLVYSLTGAHKRTFKYADMTMMEAYNFDSETILIYDVSGV